MNPAADGCIPFENPAGEVRPATTARAFANSVLGRSAAMKLSGLRTCLSFESAAIRGQTFRVEIFFEGESLHRMDLFFHQSDDKKGWDGWTRAGEQRRKETAEAWARNLFGGELAVKPFELDGALITPFEVTWETARHMEFPWGEVVSYFDSKACFAGVAITYEMFKT